MALSVPQQALGRFPLGLERDEPSEVLEVHLSLRHSHILCK